MTKAHLMSACSARDASWAVRLPALSISASSAAAAPPASGGASSVQQHKAHTASAWSPLHIFASVSCFCVPHVLFVTNGEVSMSRCV